MSTCVLSPCTNLLSFLRDPGAGVSLGKVEEGEPALLFVGDVRVMYLWFS